MTRTLTVVCATLSFYVFALPSPNPQVSDWIWQQGANLPAHVGLGDKKLREYGHELDSFPTEQDAYFEYSRLIPVKYPLGDESWHEWVDDDGIRHLEQGKIFEWITKYEQDTGKGGKQNYTVECILEKCYGDAMEKQMRRALSERATQFGGPLNEIAMIAKCNPVNLPVLQPGTPRTPFRTWAARYKIWRVRDEMLYISGRQQFCETNAFDDLVSRFKVAYKITPGFHGFVEPTCRSNDANRVSYALFPLGIVVHRACDYTEEFAHFVNVGDPYASRDFEEFKAAYHGAKVDAWKMGIDLGVSGGWNAYITALTENENWESEAVSRIPANTLLMLQLYVDGGGSADLRSWCVSDSLGRMIL